MRQLMAAGLACGMILAGAAQAQPVITNPDWVRKPSAKRVLEVLPYEAARKGVSGRAVLNCTVTTTGAVRDCVPEESPSGYGFGGAALLLASEFLMKPATQDGRAIEAKIRIPIEFKLRTMSEWELKNAKTVYEINTADWTATPSLAQFEAAYPVALRGKGVSGTTVFQCHFKKDGRLQACDQLNETPQGQGFGKAAKSLLPLFRANMAFFGDKPSSQLLITLPFHFVDPQSPDWANRTVPKPIWIRAPEAEAVLAAFPAKARTAGLKTGRAVVRCVVDSSGGLTGCTPNEETPAGMGFGQAAVTTAQAFAMLRWSPEGSPTEGVVFDMPIRIRLPDEEAPKPATKP